MLDFPADEDIPILKPHGLNNDSYLFIENHFHWGSFCDEGGSEHSIDGRFYKVEAHCVFRNAKYDTLGMAKTQRDGLLILGILYAVTDDCEELEILSHLDRVIEPRDTYEFKSATTTLKSFMKTMSFDYFSYFGSLTTPKCNEVDWVVHVKPQCMNTYDYEMLCELIADDGRPMYGNYRPICETNGRFVTLHTENCRCRCPFIAAARLNEFVQKNLNRFEWGNIGKGILKGFQTFFATFT